ncbi:class I SAM-dependent methyltransferase [Sphingomonas limnosediminicola]|uniref:Class I SAM-dependent methyltransferase n=1 Tax=Sphingomonas limnosediminicola TaxID=940133 RepID=A0ABP7LN83_9SPHN
MPDRYHGYNASVGYTAHFFPEMAPDLLDFCIREQRFEPQRSSERSYRYLDLGCGQGFHLCLLAAANPEAEFVGVDFQDDHIAHGRELANAGGLANVRFLQADFLDLAAAWPAELGTFDYVALQGILSWISPQLRDAVFQCVAHASGPGTLSVFGYNSQPGWLSVTPFQHIANQFGKTANPETALRGAITMFQRLRQLKAPLLEQLPRFKGHLDTITTKSTSYLAHEYLTDNWTALWHSSVARDLESVSLTYLGTASIAETMLPYSLAPELRDIILQQPPGPLRQDVQDIVIDQSFRRDIFCRDPRPSDSASARVGATPIYLFSPPVDGELVRFTTKFGELTISYAGIADILAAVADGPKSFAELVALENPVRPHTRSILLSMLHSGILVVGKDASASAKTAQRFNGAIARSAAAGITYEYVAAAALGSGIPVSELELLLLDTWLSSDGEIDQAALVHGVANRLRALGRQLHFRGNTIADDQLESQIAHLGQMFFERALPLWRRLGVLE